MKIGIDIDNTIACYDTLFYEVAKETGVLSTSTPLTKAELRKLLLIESDGEKKWQTLQGQVYGPNMNRATLFPGFARFLLNARYRGHEIYFISHKTKYGHFDKTKTLLRTACLNWLDNHGLFDKKKYCVDRNNVFFEDTQGDKISRICELEIDVMIDDLPDILMHPKLSTIRTFLFGKAQTSKELQPRWGWSEISNELFGCETIHCHQKLCESAFPGVNVADLKPIQNGKNSHVYKVTDRAGQSWVLKSYPDRHHDPRLRLKNEVKAFQLLHEVQSDIRPVFWSEDLDLALFTYFEGEKIISPTNKEVDQLTSFLRKLHELSQTTSKSEIEMASESCLSAAELIAQIDKRIADYKNLENPLLNEILNVLSSRYQKIKNTSLSKWPKCNLESKLPEKNWFLSPSDFGFHNALRGNNGKIIFLDFEYFGWDDPVKLCCDTILHPGMRLSSMQKVSITKVFVDLFKRDKTFIKRMECAWALYAIRWSLIVLNPLLIRSSKTRKGIDSGQNDCIDIITEKQQKLSLDILDDVEKQGAGCPYV